MKKRLHWPVWLLAILMLCWCGATPVVSAASAADSRRQDGSAPALSGVTDPGWATQVSAGAAHTCALTPEGGVKCWGDNASGQLGDGTTLTRGAPVAVVGLAEGIVMVSAGGGHTCAVTAAGGVKCWGYNGRGQLGDGTTTTRLTPVDVVGLDADVVAVSAGSGHTCALTRPGALKCWGDNRDGQLGDGTTITRLAPVEVVGLGSGVQMVSAGNSHTCAITVVGGVQCWGENQTGALGDGTWTRRLTPVDALGLSSDVRAVSAGWRDTCALLDSGGVRCWGTNHYYLLNSGNWHTPVEVVELGHNVLGISNGSLQTCVLTLGGGVKCWGWNDHGSVGDGTWMDREIPVDVVGLATGIQALAAGDRYSCALHVAGGVQCWGWNKYGQLGDGTTSDRPAPVSVWTLAYDCTDVTELPPAECDALVTFFEATNGPLWQARTDWLRTPTPCRWLGVTCMDGHVNQLALPANRLAGVLPAALGELAALQRLELSGNELAGPLPAALGQLTRLQTLDLHASGLVGVTLPAELGALTALRTLDLSGNALSGPLPAELGALTALRTLDLHDNALSGSIPPAFGALRALQTLDLSANQLTGPLPAELSALTELRTLDLSANLLTGAIPGELSHLVALQTLNLSYNALGDEIPAALGAAAALRRLDLSHNTLSGAPPWTLSQLTALEYLNLAHNQLTGELPREWSLLSALQQLDLSYNALSGWLPPEYGQLAALRYLDLGSNALRGTLPAAWGNLRWLQTLSLHSNQLAGPIPAAWSALGSAVTYDPPPGPCPDWPYPPAPGMWLDLSCNRLSGALPAALGQINGLSALDVAANQLRGPVPQELVSRPEVCIHALYNLLDNPCYGAQTLPPRDVQVNRAAPDTVILTWMYPPPPPAGCSYPAIWPVEISAATASDGPFTVLGQVDSYVGTYTISGLSSAVRYYFRLRTFSPASQEVPRPYRWGGIFDHDHVQQSNLWSDYTSVIGGEALQHRRWLPLLVR